MKFLTKLANEIKLNAFPLRNKAMMCNLTTFVDHLVEFIASETRPGKKKKKALRLKRKK